MAGNHGMPNPVLTYWSLLHQTVMVKELLQPILKEVADTTMVITMTTLAELHRYTPCFKRVSPLFLRQIPTYIQDIEHIIVQSSRVNDANDNGWNVNGAGHDVSHKYGFGVIDASAAVALAENWVNIDPKLILSV